MKHKNNLFFSALVLFFSFVCLTPTLAQTVVWDESVDGDLPANTLFFFSNTNFQDITLVSGVNIIRGTVGNNSGFAGSYRGRDSFSFIVPSGTTVTAVSLSAYSESGNGGAAIGAYSGTPLAFIASTSVSAPQDIFSSFGGGNLTAGQYGLGVADSDGINGSSVYELSITLTPNSSGAASIPTLSEWGLIVLALFLMTLGTLVLVQPDWRGGFEQER